MISEERIKEVLTPIFIRQDQASIHWPDIFEEVRAIEAEVAAPLEARIKGLIALYKERRCEICGYAEHHREHTEHTGCLRVQLASANELIEQSREALAYYAKEDTHNARHYPPEFAGDVLAAIELHQKGDKQ